MSMNLNEGFNRIFKKSHILEDINKESNIIYNSGYGEMEIIDQKGDYTLLHRLKGGYTPWVVAWKLEKNGDWGQGHYFSFQEEAKNFFDEITSSFVESCSNQKQSKKKPLEESSKSHEDFKYDDYAKNFISKELEKCNACGEDQTNQFTWNLEIDGHDFDEFECDTLKNYLCHDISLPVSEGYDYRIDGLQTVIYSQDFFNLNRYEIEELKNDLHKISTLNDKEVENFITSIIDHVASDELNFYVDYDINIEYYEEDEEVNESLKQNKRLNEGTSNFSFENVCIVVSDEDFEDYNYPSFDTDVNYGTRTFPAYPLTDYNDDLSNYVITMNPGYYSGACIDYTEIDFDGLFDDILNELDHGYFFDDEEGKWREVGYRNSDNKEVSEGEVKKYIQRTLTSFGYKPSSKDIDTILSDYFINNDFQLDRDTYDFLQQKESDELNMVKKRLEEIKRKYGYKEYGVYARFSNGETWYSPIEK